MRCSGRSGTVPAGGWSRRSRPRDPRSRSPTTRVVLLAPQVLRQTGWHGEPFLGVKLHDPTWTRARWEQAQAELTQ